jgi:hypothetical protein
MKLKRFGQFVNKINEDVVPQEEFDSLEDFKKELPEGELSEDDFDFEDDDEESVEVPEVSSELDSEFSDETEVELGDDELGDELYSDDFEEEEEAEEEGSEYEGTKKMKELASKLGVEVENNEINYNGQKIHFFSETEKFHIGKQKFETVDEVLNFLKPEESPAEEVVEDELEEPVMAESRRFIKRF